MVRRKCANFFILFGQVSQALSAQFIKRNFANSTFHLVKYDSLRKTVYILSRYTSVGTNVTQVGVLKEFYLIFGKRSTSKYLKFII